MNGRGSGCRGGGKAAKTGGAGQGRRQWQAAAALLLLVLAFATVAGAEPDSTVGASSQSAASGLTAVAGAGDAPGAAKGTLQGDSSLSGHACLKEGKACNPLNDLCCPGYYCPGGLARTCAPKP